MTWLDVRGRRTGPQPRGGRTGWRARVPAAAAACLVLVAASHAAPAKGAGERIAEKQATGIARALPAQTPPMGWNSWYALGGEDGWKTTDEQTIAEIADALVATGLAEAGYRTLVVDDSWSADVRQEGSGLQAHRSKFPSGMAATARYLHGQGLELGLYTTSGNFTCAGQQNFGGARHRGSRDHQREDAELWIREWGVTYIKHCLCNTTTEQRQSAFPAMRRSIDSALSAQAASPSDPHPPRGVVYECANYPDRPWLGGSFEGCNVWRVSSDVPDSFEGWAAVVDRAVSDAVNRRAGKHGAGARGEQQWGGSWPSFDYLRINIGARAAHHGAGGVSGGDAGRGAGAAGQTLEEYRAQMSMFAVLGAALFIGSDPRSLSAEALEIYKNAEVIAVNQDGAGLVGARLYQDGERQVEAWLRPLSPLSDCLGGLSHLPDLSLGREPWAHKDLVCQPRAALVLLNRSRRPQRISVTLLQLAGSQGLESWEAAFASRLVTRVSVRDVWKHAEVGREAVGGKVRAHGEASQEGATTPPARAHALEQDGNNPLHGEISVEVGAHAAFMGVVSLCIADEVYPMLLPGVPDDEHRVWGS